MFDKLKGTLSPPSEKPSLQKAKIIYTAGSGTKTIDCQFNPQTLTISKSVEWRAGKGDKEGVEPRPELNTPELFFGGGNPAEFSLDLIFDTTRLDNQDVRGFTNQLLQLTLMGGGDPKHKEDDPPLVQFVWGDLVLFIAVIKKVEISYTLFMASGIPVRARAKVDFIQAFDEDGPQASQNPTTRTSARKTHLVQQGDRLDYLAYQEYGQPGLWREIASANGLDDPMDIHPGQVLVIPPLS